jgi:hypothetical protein
LCGETQRDYNLHKPKDCSMHDNNVDDDEWRTAGIRKAISSLERVGGIPHREVKRWVESWGSSVELQAPKARRVGKIAGE